MRREYIPLRQPRRRGILARQIQPAPLTLAMDEIVPAIPRGVPDRLEARSGADVQMVLEIGQGLLLYGARVLDEGGHQPGLHVPFDVAVEEPDAWVLC